MKKKYILGTFVVLTIGLLTVLSFLGTDDYLLQKGIVYGPKKPKPDHPDMAVAYWTERLRTPAGENPALLNLATKRVLTDRKRKMNENTPAFHVESFGPGNFGGRVRSLLIHPEHPERILTAGVSGGVWASDDSGTTWHPQSDFLSNLAISCMAYDPDQPDRVLLGTGEGFFNVDAMRGFGIFQSLDFGKTWEHLVSTGAPSFYHVNRLAIVPGSGAFLAATREGLFRSSDGGVTWNQVRSGFGGRGFVDLKIDPSDPNIVLAYHFGSSSSQQYVARSTDGGQSFEKLNANNGLPANNISRMEIGWGTDGVVYLSVANSSSDTLGLWRSNDHGQTFAQTGSTTEFIKNNQGWYDLMVGVDPSDSNRVYLGAIDLFRSVDGGETIEQISKWSPDPGETPLFVHADHHAIHFHPSEPQTFWVGTDGGLFKSEDGGDSFVHLNNDLRIAQNYGMAVHPDGTHVITGTQDNGSHLYFGDKSTWLEWEGGDGGFCEWDRQEPNYIYGSYVYGAMYGSDNMGSSNVPLTLPNTDGADFIQPFTLDPNDGNRMMVGTDNVYFSNNVRDLANATWQDVSGDLGTLSVLAFHPSQSDTAFAAVKSGTLYKTTALSGGLNFQLLTGLVDVPTSIYFEPSDSTGETMYLTMGGYGSGRIIRSEDGGASWTSIHGDLPNIPVFSLTADPRVPGRLFAGTELGLFVGHEVEGAFRWVIFDYGVAWTRIVALEWGNQDQLWVGTHGRGTYRLNRQALVVDMQLVELAGDGDRYFDLGESQELVFEFTNTVPFPVENATFEVLSSDFGVSEPASTFSVVANGKHMVSLEAMSENLFVEPTQVDISCRLTIEGLSFDLTFPVICCANPGADNATFSSDAEQMAPFESTTPLGTEGWSVDSQYGRSGSSYFASETDSYSLKELTSPFFMVFSDQAELSFWLSYDLEGDTTQRWDGLVLEAQIDGGKWFDIGSSAQGLPYDGQLFTNNFLYLRDAWSDIKKEWRQGVVDLSTFVGSKLRFRFRLGSDQGFANPEGGVWIDDIELTGITWDENPVPDTEACASCQLSPSEHPFLAYLPFASSGAEDQTLITVINAFEEADTEVEILGFNSQGGILDGETITLAGHAAFKASLQDLFPTRHASIAWVQIGSSAPVEALADLNNAQTRSAYLASSGVVDQLFVPHVAKQTTQFETHLVTLNGSTSGSHFSFADALGQSYSIENPLAAWSQSHVRARDLLGEAVSETDWGHIQSTETNLAAMEFFTNAGDPTRMASLGLNQESGTQLRFLHLAADTSLFWTGMVYFNSSNSSLNATEYYYDNSGSLLAEKQVPLEPGAKHVVLFDHNTASDTVPEGASWMEVQADQAMVGYELFGSSSLSENDYFAGLQGSYSQGQTMVFQVFLANDSEWTGLVLINTGETTAGVTMMAYNQQGELLDSQVIDPIGAKAKQIFLGSSLFSSEVRSQIAWVKAVADGSSWDGFSLWGDHGTAVRKYLAGVRAAVR